MTESELRERRARLLVDVRFDAELRETLGEVESELARRRAKKEER